MKIAISVKGDSFTERWIKYCEEQKISYKPVDPYRSDIVSELRDCDAFMWHHSHMNSKDVLFAKSLLFSLELAGKVVFPDLKSNWHFDDKVAQKYLLESHGIDLVPSYVFYSKADALAWVDQTSFPKVFKLKGGSGSSQVRLARTADEAKSLVKRAFGKGFSQYDAIGNLKERLRRYRLGKMPFSEVVKASIRLFVPTRLARIKGNERGYAYFQDFIPNNECDIRVIVVGDKAFAIKRMVRKNDFRASGSGDIRYAKEEIEEGYIDLSFKIAGILNTQSIAFDFVQLERRPLVVEISYGFMPQAYNSCPGYWTEDMVWHDGPFDPAGWMVDLVVKASSERQGITVNL